jgi:hypothetical protein
MRAMTGMRNTICRKQTSFRSAGREARALGICHTCTEQSDFAYSHTRRTFLAGDTQAFSCKEWAAVEIIAAVLYLSVVSLIAFIVFDVGKVVA